MRIIVFIVFMVVCFFAYYISLYLSDVASDRCAEYCHPLRSGLMDTGTCACWGDKIEIIDIEDLP